MIISELLLALVIALLLTVIFGYGLRGERGRDALLIFFLILFLGSWAGGVWIAPVGPVLFGMPWLSFLFVGILLSLLILGLSPPARGPRDQSEMVEAAAAEAATSFLFNFFLGLLFGSLGLFIILHYL